MNQELFGITPPKQLFVKLAIPSLVSMLFSSIYIMADGMFVGKIIGSKALAAINIVFSIIMMILAFIAVSIFKLDVIIVVASAALLGIAAFFISAKAGEKK